MQKHALQSVLLLFVNALYVAIEIKLGREFFLTAILRTNKWSNLLMNDFLRRVAVSVLDEITQENVGRRV